MVCRKRYDEEPRKPQRLLSEANLGHCQSWDTIGVKNPGNGVGSDESGEQGALR